MTREIKQPLGGAQLRRAAPFAAALLMAVALAAAARAGWLPALRLEGALELRVPHAKGPIVVDGNFYDPGWVDETAGTGPFVDADAGRAALPHSDAVLAWGEGHLYFQLDAMDEDIRAQRDALGRPGDCFHMVFVHGATELALDVSPAGGLAGDPRLTSGTSVANEIVGTPNEPKDHDKEWLVEMAIPLEALGLRGQRGERIGFSIRRCDTSREGMRSCGSWGEGERPGVLILDR